jgi:hypothetical protein
MHKEAEIEQKRNGEFVQEQKRQQGYDGSKEYRERHDVDHVRIVFD